MAEQRRKVRWPDGVSVSTPALGVWPGVGATYYFNPGSPSAPQLTVTQRRGLGGGGLRAVFLGKDMTSQDTLGAGATANAGAGVNATINTSIPDIRQPWKMRVSSIEGGIGLPGFAVTGTSTPEQIAEFLNKHIFNRAGPPNRAEFVRDSAAAAGVPGRNNVFEYGYPDSGDARPNVFDSGAPPVLYVPAPQQKVGGLPGLLAGVAGTDPTNPTQPAPPAGGLLGLLQEYIRNNPDGGATR